MFTVKCNNCEAETTFTRRLTENGTEIVSNNKDLEIDVFLDAYGWSIYCNVCTSNIEQSS